MAPPAGCSTAWSSPAPRTRGDGPLPLSAAQREAFCSPRPRGWTLPLPGADQGSGLLPDLEPLPGESNALLSRARRDDPALVRTPARSRSCFPFARGWTLLPNLGDGRQRLLPASAGMAPDPSSRVRPPRPAPRLRGDGPAAPAQQAADLVCSPCPRVVVVDYRCSPHARGWPRREQRHRSGATLLPAPAGCSLLAQGCIGEKETAPHARGDVPSPTCPPRPRRPVPRTCGDGPSTMARAARSGVCSPLAWGWPQDCRGIRGAQALLPAPAGMDPLTRSWPSSGARCFLHPRGWSFRDCPVGVLCCLLPAPAGMNPSRLLAVSLSSAVPRWCGDGPVRWL